MELRRLKCYKTTFKEIPDTNVQQAISNVENLNTGYSYYGGEHCTGEPANDFGHWP